MQQFHAPQVATWMLGTLIATIWDSNSLGDVGRFWTRWQSRIIAADMLIGLVHVMGRTGNQFYSPFYVCKNTPIFKGGACNIDAIIIYLKMALWAFHCRVCEGIVHWRRSIFLFYDLLGDWTVHFLLRLKELWGMGSTSTNIYLYVRATFFSFMSGFV